jgi:alkaline phosphatase
MLGFSPTVCAREQRLAPGAGLAGIFGHSPQLVFAAVVGRGSARFQGYMENTEFGRALLGRLGAR